MIKRMIKVHPTENRMRPLDRSTYGVPAIVSSRLGTRLCRRRLLMTTPRPDPPPSKSSLVMPTTSPRAFSSGPPELSRLLL
jgi:hypothetical protein